MTGANKEKWIFIVNPAAGNGYAETVAPVIEEMIKKHEVDGEIVFTEKPGHGTDLSRKYLEMGYGYIIGVGGDGTLNEIAKPLTGNKDIVTGIIPAGTGNDFIQILGFPNRFKEKEWDIFFNKKIISMDVGNVNGMIFLNGMGLGFDAEVAAQNYTESGQVKKGSANKYIWHILKTLLFFKEKRMIVTDINGSYETDCFINTIATGRRFAGSFFLTPKALANDGLLDVCMIKRLNLLQRFQILFMVPSGKHIKDKKVNYYQIPEIELKFTEKVPFHVDGELNFADKFAVHTSPEALNIIYNPDGQHFFRR